MYILKISIIIPTYNEADNIEYLIKAILKLPITCNIIVIDDDSPDNTKDIVTELAKEYEDITLINRPNKMGIGTAHKYGFKKALEINSDKIVTMDADFSHNPKYLMNMINLSDKFDVTVGSRYTNGGGVDNWPIHRKILSKAANFITRKVLSLKVRDCTGGFRCYNRKILQDIDVNDITSDGYSFLIELIYVIEKNGYSIGELPIIFTDRVKGKSKISKKEILNAVRTIVRIKNNEKRYI